jgi:hypothetical protein
MSPMSNTQHRKDEDNDESCGGHWNGRVGAAKHLVLADLRPGNAEATAEIFRNAGFDVSTENVDVSSRKSVEELVQTVTMGKRHR